MKSRPLVTTNGLWALPKRCKDIMLSKMIVLKPIVKCWCFASDFFIGFRVHFIWVPKCNAAATALTSSPCSLLSIAIFKLPSHSPPFGPLLYLNAFTGKSMYALYDLGTTCWNVANASWLVFALEQSVEKAADWISCCIRVSRWIYMN